jgi:hypothetical protein
MRLAILAMWRFSRGVDSRLIWQDTSRSVPPGQNLRPFRAISSRGTSASSSLALNSRIVLNQEQACLRPFSAGTKGVNWEASMLSPALLMACVGFVVYCTLDIVRSLPDGSHNG